MGIIYGIEHKPNPRRNYKEIKDDVVEEADICIIGSGAAGAVLAKELVESRRKLRVVLLEKGGYYEGQDMNQRDPDMMPLLWRNGGAVFDDGLRIAIGQGSCLGGSTIINDAVCFDPPQQVRTQWRAEGVNFSKPEWKRHIAKVRQMLTVKRVKEGELNRNNKQLRKGANALGFREHGRNERNCINCMQCGFCHLGCHYETKQDVLKTYLTEALKKSDSHMKIYCNCAVHTIVHNNGRVEGVEGDFRKAEGSYTPLEFPDCPLFPRQIPQFRNKNVCRIRVNAKIFIISAGAISSSKLLLRNGIAQKTAGRGLCLHPSPFVIAEFDEEIKGNQGIPMAYTIRDFGVCRERDQTRVEWGVDGDEHQTNRIKREWPVVRGDCADFLIEAVFVPIYQFAMALPSSVYEYPRLIRRFNNLAMAGILVRDSPKPANRVALTPTDRASVTYTLGDEEVKAIAESTAIVAKMWFECGAKGVITSHKKRKIVRNKKEIPELYKAILDDQKSLVLVSAHPQSGNKIGNPKDPKYPNESVVDSDCKVHDFKNLFVCDASVFPTSVGVNPQITIMTVASIIASRIIDKWDEYERMARNNSLPSCSLGKTCDLSQPMYCLRDPLSEKFNNFTMKGFNAKDLVNKGNWNFDSKNMMIENDLQWRGFLPREEDILSTLFLYLGGFWKRFTDRRSTINGVTHPLGFTVSPIYARNTAKDMKLGGRNVVVLEYDKPYNSVYDVLKIVNENTIIGKAFWERDVRMSQNEIIVSGKEILTFAMARTYPFEFMTQEDHENVYDSAKVKKPVLKEMVGVWDGHIVFDSAWVRQLFRFRFYLENGNLKCNYLLGGILSGTACVEESGNHVVMQHFTGNFNHKIKWVNSKTLIGKYYSAGANRWLPENLFDQGFYRGSDGRNYIPYVLEKIGQESAFRGGDVFGYKGKTPTVDLCTQVLQSIGLS